MYHYEALGDERFQQLCQALIVADFPEAQCLPVGQPDGGRDAYWIRHALTSSSAGNRRELVVFQVKFAKTGSDTRDAREMIKAVVRSERPKIKRLIRAGLQRYYLITNVGGTSHLGQGSIDQINQILSDELGIEAYCWWRDDLDRRLDGHANVKWSYPEVLKASDLLQALVAGALGEDEERRRNAIRAYMVAQYDDDQELKFKQTDLRSTMSDLFVDLPMRLSTDQVQADEEGRVRYLKVGGARRMFYATRGYVNFDEDGILAAAYFSAQNTREDLSRVVLEGAPGQGKSTVTQFMCQIMRMHLLDRQSDLAKLPEHFRQLAVRIPFRIDLRDLAKWIAGIDPFQPKDVPLDEREPKSLEGFLAAQVRFASGGHDFSVSDLTAVAKASNILIALDGFDEVADVALRQQLVTEIRKGCGRLTNAGVFSVRTIVTSRPAAFAKSIRFPRDQWSYFELLPLDRKQVDDYTHKWMRAKGIKEIERAQLVKILDVKLQEPHTQFLAKNPMQLTILLSLIHNRGASLPEKRTAMYDAYMDMFFSRESEKSAVVRDHRDLLIDIHRYLAWTLQTDAEGGGNGSIEQSALRETLLLYLDREGESTSIVSDLFDGIIERVGALVSRVQGAYEFEVQPLREYFAARYLYETAPYSPVGDEKSGTKLDRFDALIRNPYWLNVARFYGGCFSKGEISALVDEIQELCCGDDFGRTSHPRSVALMLLGDWVFTQYQPAVKRVVALITEHPQLRQLLANAEHANGIGWSALPERSGRLDFVEALWKRAIATSYADERRALSNAIYENTKLPERTERWRIAKDKMDHSDWVDFGKFLRIFFDAADAALKSFSGDLSKNLIIALLEARQFDLLQQRGVENQSLEIMLNDMRPSGVDFGARLKHTGRLELLYTICGYYQYRLAIRTDDSVPMRHQMARRFGHEAISPQLPERGRYLSDDEQAAVIAHDQFLEFSAVELSASIEPWSELVRTLRRAWGDCRAFDRIAFMAAGVPGRSVSGQECRLAEAEDLVLAARFVRLKSGAPRWWRTKLAQERDIRELSRLLLLLLMWGTPRTMLLVQDTLVGALDRLSEDEWFALYRDYKVVSEGRKSDDRVRLRDSEIADVLDRGSRLSTFVGLRADTLSQFQLASTIAADMTGLIKPEIQFCMDAMLNMCRRYSEWELALPNIKRLYDRGGNVPGSLHGGEYSFALSLAETISTDLVCYPLALLALADNQLRSATGSGARKLSDIASSEHWFCTS